jgi:hypothetical protein
MLRGYGMTQLVETRKRKRKHSLTFSFDKNKACCSGVLLDNDENPA